MKSIWLVVALLAVGCSGGSSEVAVDAGPDAYGHKPIHDDAGVLPSEGGVDCNAGSTPSTTYPGPHPAMPQLVSSGGPVLAHPHFIPIVFSAEDRTKDIGAFTKALATSSYWSTIAAEYGVGAATASDPIVLAETAPAEIEDADIAAWLRDKLDGLHVPFGVPDPDAIYTIYYPTTTTIDTPWGSSCQLFGGYHTETVVGKTPIAYAVIARCIDEMSGITAHELFEASTDPRFNTAPAYIRTDDATQGSVAEIGDLCEMLPEFFSTELGFKVPPMWSNAASAAGKPPCVPSDGTPYFRTIAEVSDVVNGLYHGLKIAPGETKTIELAAFSDRDTGGPWNVKVSAGWSSWQDKLVIAQCRTSAENGERIPVTITRPTTSTDAVGVEVVSTLGTATTTYFFWAGD